VSRSELARRRVTQGGVWRLGTGLVLFAVAAGASGPDRGAIHHLVWRQHRVRIEVSPGPSPRIEATILTPGRAPIEVTPLALRWRVGSVSVGDVDDDGRLELLVMVWKRTRYHRPLAWRPFLYTLADGRWVPKWLGSRVGRELIEARLACPGPGPSKLVTLEQGHDAARYLTVYHWRGFGFWGERTVSLPREAARLKVMPLGGGCERIVILSADGSPMAKYPDVDSMTASGGQER